VRILLHLIAYIPLFCGIFACSNDDDFSPDGNMSLVFSSDTISFDTVFTTIGSATRRFQIYNKNSKSLVIGSIELMNPVKSGFRMNIDGEKGTKLSNVEILKKDSLFGFIEVTVNHTDNENPLLIRDSIRFETNGSIQYLQLEAVGQDVYIWKGKRIIQDSVITGKKPLLVYDSIVIDKGVTATMTEGAKIFFRNSASIRIHGTLIARGTIEKPVVFRGDRFDKIEADIPYNNVPGQWDGVYFYPESYNNQLENINIRNATKCITFYASDIRCKKATLLNVVVQNTTEYGVSATNSNIDGGNCLFVNSKGTTLFLNGGKYSFLHCTIANYFRWSARTAESLVISNSKETPLAQCNFMNSIVYGSLNKEFLMNRNADAVHNHRFINCLIKGMEISDSYFKNIIWNKDPLFTDLNTEGTYSYNFKLQESSPAIDKADKTYSKNLPLDLRGKSRQDSPDIGCYERVK
jgi:hypothetical protein